MTMRSARVTSASAPASTARSTAEARSSRSVMVQPASVPAGSGRPSPGPGGESDVAQGRHGRGQQRRRLGQVERALGLDQGVGVVVRPVGPGAEQDLDVGAGQQAGQLHGGGEGAQRDGDRPDARGGQPAHHEVGAVGVQQPHMGAPVGADGHEGPGQLGRSPLRLAVGEDLVVGDQQRGVARGRRPLGQQGADGEGQAVAGVDDRRGHGERRGDTGGQRLAVARRWRSSPPRRTPGRRAAAGRWTRCGRRAATRSISNRRVASSGVGRR